MQRILSGITIGTSFSPEELEHKGLSYFQIVEALEIAHQKFGIKDIRFGIRWNKAVNNEGEIDLSYYKPFLDYCLNHDINLTLNVGPIKTFRWPEEHVPKQILRELKHIPHKGAYIREESELAKQSILYLEKLLNELKSKYSEKELENIVMIQPENEPFKRFGVHKWIMDIVYMQKLAEVIWEFFPQMDILLNSSGCINIPKCIKVLEKYSERSNKFTFGINYYYKTPFNQKFRLLSWYDDIWKSRLRGLSCAKNKKLSRRYGYKIEVTEAQLEGWGQKIKGPGQSVKEFKKMMHRVSKYILPDEGGVIRLWGMENFARDYIFNQFSEEQEEITENIKLLLK